MNGSTFAILAALCFASNNIFIRRGVTHILDPTLGVLISVPVGLPFVIVLLVLTGEISSIAGFSWQSYIWLSAAGILHYMVGRSLSYHCTQLVGANIANILRRSSAIVAVVLGVSVLGEPLSWQLISGVVLIIFGLTIPGLNLRVFSHDKKLPWHIPRRAFISGFGTGVSWGITPILVKVGLGSSGSPTAGVFISFSAATIGLSLSLLNRNRRTAFVGMAGKAAVLFCIGGLISCTAHLMRYMH